MVVADFHVVGVAISPSEAHTVLIVDANAVLSGTVSLECFKAIARWYAKIFQHHSRIQIFQFPASRTLDVHKAANAYSAEKSFPVPISEGLEHGVSYTETRDTSNRQQASLQIGSAGPLIRGVRERGISTGPCVRRGDGDCACRGNTNHLIACAETTWSYICALAPT